MFYRSMRAFAKKLNVMLRLFRNLSDQKRPSTSPTAKSERRDENSARSAHPSTATYKVPEYYGHSAYYFYDSIIALKPRRLPQPDPTRST
ncbi:unnamed protein product [Dicrocoelium dendriticum]|nr:unnamed protein product [Dicrocoelium dendriticum]